MATRDWIDGRRIEGYCTRKGYTAVQILDIREIHRLHQLYPEGSPGGRTLQEALEQTGRATPSQKAFLREASRKTEPWFGHAFLRLAEDPEYANEILAAYLTDVKPALGLA